MTWPKSGFCILKFACSVKIFVQPAELVAFKDHCQHVHLSEVSNWTIQAIANHYKNTEFKSSGSWWNHWTQHVTMRILGKNLHFQCQLSALPTCRTRLLIGHCVEAAKEKGSLQHLNWSRSFSWYRDYQVPFFFLKIRVDMKDFSIRTKVVY